MLFVVVCRRFGSSVRSEVVKFQRQCEPVIPKKKKWSASIFHTRSLPSIIRRRVVFVRRRLLSVRPVNFIRQCAAGTRVHFKAEKRSGTIYKIHSCRNETNNGFLQEGLGYLYKPLNWKIQIYYCLRFLKIFWIILDQNKKSRTKTTQHSTRGTSVETSTITFFFKQATKTKITRSDIFEWIKQPKC